MILLNFPISKVRILDLLRFERVSSLFSASFFFASFLLCFSALLFFSGHPTITPSFHLPFASRIARELQVNRTGPEPYQFSSGQSSCSKSYMESKGGTLSVQFSSVVQNHIWVIVLLFFVLFLFSSCFILVFLSFLAFFLLNSPGLWPIGVLDLPLLPSVVLLCSQTAQSRGAPGVSAGKVRATRTRRIPLNLRQGHGDL